SREAPRGVEEEDRRAGSQGPAVALSLLAHGASAAVRKAAAEALLKKLYRPIRPGLDRTERVLAAAAEEGGHVIRPMARHLLRRPGKRIRAALVLFSAKAGRK